MNREEWLLAMTERLQEPFKRLGAPLPPNIRVSCGFPLGKPYRGERRIHGQCFHSKISADGSSQVFISPRISDSLEVGSILVHELVHAADRCESGHKGNFRRIATAIGLEGRMASTTAGLELTARLNDIIKEIGQYPHAALNPQRHPQSTRMVKLVCPHCGYIVRTTAKWLAVGSPKCPDGIEMVTNAAPE